MIGQCCEHMLGDNRVSDYPLRKLARAFAYVGAAAVAYAAALVAIAVETAIIEF